MALALDESKDDDETHEVDGIKFLVSPNVNQVLQTYGGVNISFADYPWGGQLVIKASDATACC